MSPGGCRPAAAWPALSPLHLALPLLLPAPEAVLGPDKVKVPLRKGLEDTFSIKIKGRAKQATLRYLMLLHRAAGVTLSSGKDITTEAEMVQFLLEVRGAGGGGGQLPGRVRDRVAVPRRVGVNRRRWPCAAARCSPLSAF